MDPSITEPCEQMTRHVSKLATWERIHVCFEHPEPAQARVECTDEVCITCSDEGT